MVAAIELRLQEKMFLVLDAFFSVGLFLRTMPNPTAIRIS
jgi:hypothetical protein